MSDGSDDCVFCKIISGDIPADLLGRSDRAIVFKDLNPQAPFHALVVPLQHHENAAATSVNDPSAIGYAIVLADEVVKAAGHDDYRLIFNTGAGAGQSVFHTHVHVLAGATDLSESLV